MNHSYTEIFKFSITLLSIINPIGAIPVFLGFTQNNKNLNLKNVTNTCASATSITILISLIFGNQLLNFFGISVASFTIGGGILLFMMALSMISGEQSNTKINNEEIKSFDYEREKNLLVYRTTRCR
jgi:multiple antibiotic resistance protein